MSRGTLLIVGGGQSGLAAARAARDHALEPVVLEAGSKPAGSWPGYYESLRLFSPRRYSSFPGYPFPGAPEDYPRRDEVVSYLVGYADWLGVEIRTSTRVSQVTAQTGAGFTAVLADGGSVTGEAVVAASGSFASPHTPDVPGQEEFAGRVLHVAQYQSPEPYAGQRVLVVGAGNSAIQVAHELTHTARVSLAVRDQVRFAPQKVAGRDLHWWLARTGADRLPPTILNRIVTGTPVIDTGTYRAAVASGQLEERRMFTAFTPDGVLWPDGSREQVDTVIFATGYRPHLPYMATLGVLNEAGLPLHEQGVSTVLPGLGYLGLELQRSFSSNTLRGVHRDAAHVVTALSRDRQEAVGRDEPRRYIDVPRGLPLRS